MTPSNLDRIVWPDESRITQQHVTSPTLRWIYALFNGTGVATSIIYSVLLLIVKPQLVTMFSQRCELSAAALMSARKLVVSLQRRIKATPLMILGYNESGNYIEHTTQTETDNYLDPLDFVMEDKDNGPPVSRWHEITSRLDDINTDLDTFNKLHENRSNKQIQSFSDSCKLLSNQINHIDGTNLVIATTGDLKKSIREVKGWFVSGKVR